MGDEGTGPRLGLLCRTDPGIVRTLESLPIDSLWVGGHVASRHPTTEPVAQLARLSALTERVRIGTAVLPLPLYPPALLAKQLADLDRASGGRIVLGVGVGGDYPQEFRACEVPLARRGARTDEVIGLLRELWTGAPVHHRGTFHRVDDVRIRPVPVRAGGVPVLVAGRGPAAMRRAALLGDGWLPYLYSAERYRSSVAEVRRLAAAAGRDLAGFEWAVFLFCVVAADGDDARTAAVRHLGDLHGTDVGPLLGRGLLAGTVEEVARQVRAYVDAGARELVVAPLGPEPDKVARLIAEEVVPAARAR